MFCRYGIGPHHPGHLHHNPRHTGTQGPYHPHHHGHPGHLGHHHHALPTLQTVGGIGGAQGPYYDEEMEGLTKMLSRSFDERLKVLEEYQKRLTGLVDPEPSQRFDERALRSLLQKELHSQPFIDNLVRKLKRLRNQIRLSREEFGELAQQLSGDVPVHYHRGGHEYPNKSRYIKNR